MNTQRPGSIVAAAVAALHDLRCYLPLISPQAYGQPMDLLSGSTIGQHTRHILEFYACLAEQGEGNPNPRINYAARRRDFQLESDPEYALAQSQVLAGRLGHLEESKACSVDCSEHGEEGLETRSTLGREIQYNVEHTIHHLAIIKIALRLAAPGISLPDHFGVAPSTIRHRQDACAQ